MAQQVARQEVDNVRKALEMMKPQMQMALPTHLKPERMLRIVMTAVQNTPKLLQCNRQSLFSAIMSACQLGLEPDGVLGQAYLVPYGDKVQFIPGYKGLITLARNSGEVVSIQAHEVRAKDFFEYRYGLEEKLEHRPAATGGKAINLGKRTPEEIAAAEQADEDARGPITHFYAYAKFRDGGHAFEVMPVEDVIAIRNRSEGWKAFEKGWAKSSPWMDHFPQMGRKTAIRRLANYLPRSVQKAIEIEAAYERGNVANLDAYGDIVIEGGDDENEAGGQQQETGGDKAATKMDGLAGEEGGGQGAGTSPPPPPADKTTTRKPRETKPKADAAPETKPASDFPGDKPSTSPPTSPPPPPAASAGADPYDD